MHTLGKVLLGFVAVLAVVALVLTSMLYDAQGAWQKKVEGRLATRADSTEQLRQKKLVVNDLEAEANRRMMSWGRAWELSPQQVQLLDPNEGIVGLGIVGLAQQEASPDKPLPTIHLFGKNEDGTSNYIGAFRITAAEQNQVSAQMIRRPYPGETDQWQAAAGVRVWEAVPSNWRALNAELQAQTAIALQDVQDQQARLATQKLLVAKSQEQRERRMAELNGDPDPVDGAGQDTIDGLVVALRKEESARNQQLAELDQLRHEYNAKYNRLMELLEENRTLSGQLPQPSSENGSPVGPAVGGTQSSAARR